MPLIAEFVDSCNKICIKSVCIIGIIIAYLALECTKKSFLARVVMGREEKRLIRKAQSVYKKIFPCGGKESFKDCFTKYEDKLFLWFDTEDQSTHIMTEDIAYK